MAPDNPPAFPLGVPHMTEYQPEWGMSLRDYFAGQALAALVALAPQDAASDIMQGIRAGGPIAYGAYALADAMLRARSAEFGNIGADGAQS